jgi:hypothetical protein
MLRKAFSYYLVVKKLFRVTTDGNSADIQLFRQKRTGRAGTVPDVVKH